MWKYLNKGISTPLAFGVIIILSILVGFFTITQLSEMRKERITFVSELIIPEKKEVKNIEESLEEKEEIKTNEINDWTIYRNLTYSYEIEYPQEVKERENFRTKEKPYLSSKIFLVPCYTMFEDIPEEERESRKYSSDNEEKFESGASFIEIEIAENPENFSIKEWLDKYIKPSYEFYVGKPNSWENLQFDDIAFAKVKGLKINNLPSFYQAGGCSPKIFISKNSKIYSIGICCYEAALYSCSEETKAEDIISTFKFID